MERSEEVRSGEECKGWNSPPSTLTPTSYTPSPPLTSSYTPSPPLTSFNPHTHLIHSFATPHLLQPLTPTSYTPSPPSPPHTLLHHPLTSSPPPSHPLVYSSLSHPLPPSLPPDHPDLVPDLATLNRSLNQFPYIDRLPLYLRRRTASPVQPKANPSTTSEV